MFWREKEEALAKIGGEKIHAHLTIQVPKIPLEPTTKIVIESGIHFSSTFLN